MSKRTIAILLILASTLSLCAQLSIGASETVGDTNGDGTINSLDAAWILQYDALLRAEINNADANGDGAVNSLDAATILKYDALLIDRLPGDTAKPNEEESRPEESAVTEHSSKDVCTDSEGEEDTSSEAVSEETSADESDTAEEEESFKTSHYQGEYVELDIEGNRLTVSGVLEFEGMDAVWIRLFEHESDTLLHDEYIDVPAGGFFSAEFDLSGSATRKYITVYHHETGDIYSWSYLDKRRYFISHGDEGYYLERSPVLEHNKAELEKYVDPQSGFYFLLSDEMRRISDSLLKDEESDYDKIHSLYRWVCENVYYDMDFYSGSTDSVFLSPEDVYRNRYTVCQGYVNLLCALIQAQGIPCIQTDVYGQFPIDSVGAESNVLNHVILEVYLEEEGRWMLIDPTWSSANRYQNGVFTEGYNLSRYFDITVEELSVCHKILKRKSPWFWYN